MEITRVLCVTRNHVVCAEDSFYYLCLWRRVTCAVALKQPCCHARTAVVVNLSIRSRGQSCWTGTVPYATGTVPYATGTVPYATGTVPYATGTVPYVTGTVPYATGTVPYATGTVPYATGTVPYATGTVPYATGTVPHATPVPTNTAPTFCITAILVIGNFLCKP